MMDSKGYDEEGEQHDIQVLQSSHLTLAKILFLELQMFSPVIWVICFLWILKMPLACQIAFQVITLFGVPCISLRIQGRSLTNLLQVKSYKMEIFFGVLFLIVSCLATVFTGYLIMQYYDILDYDSFKTIQENKFNLILALILLTVTNPFLEEFFWRSYLTDQYVNNDQRQYTETLKWFLSSHYAFYHTFVIYFFTKNWIVSIIGLMVITIGGRVFFLTRDKIGLIATSLFHMGVDLGIVLLAIYEIYK